MFSVWVETSRHVQTLGAWTRSAGLDSYISHHTAANQHRGELLVPSCYQAHAVPVSPVQTDLQLCYSDSVGQMKLHLTEFHILDVSHLCGLIIKCSVGSWTGVKKKNGFCCSHLVDKSSETGIMVQYAEDAVWYCYGKKSNDRYLELRSWYSVPRVGLGIGTRLVCMCCSWCTLTCTIALIFISKLWSYTLYCTENSLSLHMGGLDLCNRWLESMHGYLFPVSRQKVATRLWWVASFWRTWWGSRTATSAGLGSYKHQPRQSAFNVASYSFLVAKRKHQACAATSSCPSSNWPVNYARTPTSLFTADQTKLLGWTSLNSTFWRLFNLLKLVTKSSAWIGSWVGLQDLSWALLFMYG